MNASAEFYAIVLLSHWLPGFDRYARAYSKSHLAGRTHPGVFYVADDSDLDVVREKARGVLGRHGAVGDALVRIRCRLPVGVDGAQPNTFTGTGVGWRWPNETIPVDGVAMENGDGWMECAVEEVTARAFALPAGAMMSWAKCRPRSFSVLPVAKACNANCAFCFSKASVSDDTVMTGIPLDVGGWVRRARDRGAERAVISGGGEPTLIGAEAMTRLIADLAAVFDSVLLISNGSLIDRVLTRNREEGLSLLRSWKAAGLTRLAISRHGLDTDGDARILGRSVDGAAILAAAQEAGLMARFIGVLQKGGIDSVEGVKNYIRRCAADGVSEVCLKELYVSSLIDNSRAGRAENRYCREHQVPLSTVLRGVAELGLQRTSTLPWGSPVFRGDVDGVPMSVAAYTEPSVGWERTHGVVRSWNLLADGRCLASLEDDRSAISEQAAS